jgi:glutathione S-transferase
MADLKIYGTVYSRTYRPIWAALELGLDFDLIEVDSHTDDVRKPEYLELNPNGLIPTIKDGEFVLWESYATTTYLAKKHGGPLAPANLEEDALNMQWTLWGLHYLEAGGVALVQDNFLPEDERNPNIHAEVQEMLAKPLGVLEGHLAEREYILGDRFTITDLNVAANLAPVLRFDFDLSSYPKVAAWLKKCATRPASIEARKVEPVKEAA